jgi:hypothetical protein
LKAHRGAARQAAPCASRSSTPQILAIDFQTIESAVHRNAYLLAASESHAGLVETRVVHAPALFFELQKEQRSGPAETALIGSYVVAGPFTPTAIFQLSH